MSSPTDKLKQSLADAISQASGLEQKSIFPLLEKPKKREHGDLAFPCFQLAKLEKRSPAECASAIAEKIDLPDGFEQLNVLGPFLNFSFKRAEFVTQVLQEVLKSKENYASDQTGRGTVVIDYSSPNIAKPFHVGHLRATLIGNSLDRIYRHLGYQLESINHLGDWGTQFGFVWAGCQLWGKPKNPSVAELVDLYRKATGLKAEQEKGEVSAENAELPDVNEIARQYFLNLEAEQAEAKAFWQTCVDISLDYLRKIYQRLGVSFDHYLGESFYFDKIEGVRTLLEKTDLLVESDGAFGVPLAEDLGFARVFTPDGRSLYLTRDLAAVLYRAERFKFDRALYVVGAPQALHFRQLAAVLEKAGDPNATRLEHVSFGHVLGIKTRGDGDFVELNDFLDEASKRALDAYHEQVSRRPEGLDENEVAKGVALAAIIFSNLSRSRIKDVQFSWKHALEFQGDTGPYLLYAAARMNGIKEKAKEEGLLVQEHLEARDLIDDYAYYLASTLAEFPQTLEKCVQDNDPFFLANYALELAKEFSRAYQHLQVVGEETSIAEARLALFEACGNVLKLSLKLLGIQPLERM